ncbi:MAG: hypothetical protein ABL951_05605 [Alphaproteobacteria bacterium]
MAFIYITEYAEQARDTKGHLLPAGLEPAITDQRVGNAGASAQSAALNERTKFVMIHADSICSIKFGLNPTAVVTAHRMGAGETRYYGVNIASLKVAAVLNT